MKDCAVFCIVLLNSCVFCCDLNVFILCTYLNVHIDAVRMCVNLKTHEWAEYTPGCKCPAEEPRCSCCCAGLCAGKPTAARGGTAAWSGADSPLSCGTARTADGTPAPAAVNTDHRWWGFTGYLWAAGRSSHLTVRVLDDAVERRHQCILLMEDPSVTRQLRFRQCLWEYRPV